MISVILLTANVRNRETKKGVLQISYYAEHMLCNVFTKDYTRAANDHGYVRHKR